MAQPSSEPPLSLPTLSSDTTRGPESAQVPRPFRLTRKTSVSVPPVPARPGPALSPTAASRLFLDSSLLLPFYMQFVVSVMTEGVEGLGPDALTPPAPGLLLCI